MTTKLAQDQIEGFESNIKSFGAVADWDGLVGTDNTAAIQEAIDFGDPVYIPEGDFAFGSKITNPDMVPIHGPGRLYFTGSGEHAFVFGAADGFSHVYNSTMQSNIYLERATKDWTDQFGGVCLFNTEGHQLTIHSRKFYYPIYLQGFDKGCTFNNYYIKLAGDGVSQILMHANGTNGWVNQNNIYGGRLFTESTSTSASNISGIEFKTDSVSIINGNTFYNPSFELYNIGAGVTQCFKGSGNIASGIIAIENKLVSGRIELTDYVLGGNGVSQNDFDFAATEYSPSSADTILNPDDNASRLELIQNDFDLLTGRLGLDEPKTIASLNKTNMVTQQPGGAELGCKPARGCIYKASTIDNFVFHDASIGLKHDSITNSSSSVIVGFLLDLRNVNEDYTATVNLKAITNSAGGRFAVACYDASYNLLEVSNVHTNMNFFSGNGLFSSGEDMTLGASEQQLAFGSGVSYAIVGVAGGATPSPGSVSTSADIRSLEIFAYGRADISICYDQQAVAGIGVTTVNSVAVAPIIDTDTPLATQAPLAPVAGNSYPVGLDVINADPVTTEASGWVRGTGTWLAKAALT